MLQQNCYIQQNQHYCLFVDVVKKNKSHFSLQRLHLYHLEEFIYHLKFYLTDAIAHLLCQPMTRPISLLLFPWNKKINRENKVCYKHSRSQVYIEYNAKSTFFYMQVYLSIRKETTSTKFYCCILRSLSGLITRLGAKNSSVLVLVLSLSVFNLFCQFRICKEV